MGDGAEWIYHARQHLWEVVRKLYPHDEAKQKAWMTMHQRQLDRGKIAKLADALRAISPTTPKSQRRFAPK